jgi:hypothetical protein
MRSLLPSFLLVVALGCGPDDATKSFPRRHVTAHALVWNGGEHRIGPVIMIFDAPVACSAIPHLRDEAPAGVTLELVALPRAWEAGAASDLRSAGTYDDDGRLEPRNPDSRGMSLSLSSPFGPTIRTAPRKGGSHAVLRLDVEVFFTRGTKAAVESEHEDNFAVDLSGDVEAEVCGDIE